MNSSIAPKRLANAIRALAIDMIEEAQSGHPGMPLGMADVASVLFRSFLNFHPKDPEWPNRDRFIISAGHGSALLYSLLYLTGYNDWTIGDLKKFRQFKSKAPGHPEFNPKYGIETTTGPLGQGLAHAVGMAISAKMLSAKICEYITDHKIYVVVGDGCMMEGIAYEALSLAGHLKLNNLVVLFDNNGISIDGSTALVISENQYIKLEAMGWHVLVADGHDYTAINNAFTAAQNSERPTFISFKTQIGFGSPNKAGSAGIHGTPLGSKEIQLAKDNLDWPHQPFFIPDDILKEWRAAYARCLPKYKEWRVKYASTFERAKTRVAQTTNALIATLETLKSGKITPPYGPDSSGPNNGIVEATRQSSQKVIEAIFAHHNLLCPLIGGSADLTPSNCTRIALQKEISASDFSGHYIHYGIREHAMIAILSGIASSRYFIPYGGTFLVFSDYCRPAIRLASMMQLPIIMIFTHDSIGVGEDGPTHQPIEHLCSLRAIPNLNVYRPCDVIETIECWQLALCSHCTPSVLALSRQSMPQIRSQKTHQENQNLSSLGAYIIGGTPFKEGAIAGIYATGSEVSIAIEAARILLKTYGIKCAVVSMPCIELYLQQSIAYHATVMPPSVPKIFIEAGISQSFDRFINNASDIFIGLSSFGASAKAEELYKYFGLTKDHIVKAVLKATAYIRSDNMV